MTKAAELEIDNATAEQIKQAIEGQQRDEHGKFVATTTVEEQPKEFKVEIDLEDGGGVQVFKAATQDELVEKLRVAQANATRKIRQQNEQLKTLRTQATVKPRYQEKTITPDEEFIIGQEFATSPTKAFAKMFEAKTGMTLEEFRQNQAEVIEIREQNKAVRNAQEFIERHPEYVATAANAKKINAYIATHGLPNTLDSVEEAYENLVADGLLVTEEKTETTGTRIETPKPKARNTMITGTGTARTAATTTGKKDLTPAEMEKMSTKQLEQWIIDNQPA